MAHGNSNKSESVYPTIDIYHEKVATKPVNVEDTHQTQPNETNQEINTSVPVKFLISSKHESSKRSAIPTRLVIPSLKVDTQIVSILIGETTWNLDGLGDKIAWLERSPNDQPLNNTVLAGHVTLFNGSNGPFRYLSRLKPGSKIIVFNGDQAMTYQVRDLSLVYPDGIEVLKDTKNKELTLLTCITWDETTKSYLRRLVVRADLVEIETKIVQE
jgi:LPXTG-site transpeptidase (sortase) family protein